MTARRRQSLRWRLPLFVTGLIAVILVAYLWAANRVIETALLRSGGERAQNAATQIADALTQSGEAGMQVLTQAATNDGLRAFIERPTDAARAALTRTFTGQNLNSPRRVEIWNAAGELLLEVAQRGGTGAPPPRGALPTGVGIRPLHLVDQTVVSDSIVEVREAPDPSRSGAPRSLGYLVVRSTLSQTSRSGLLGKLVGEGAVFEVGNRIGGAWTDLARAVPPPPVDLMRNAVLSYTEKGVTHIGAVAGIRSTPWVLWVELPHDAIVAPARPVLLIMMGLAIVFVVVGGSTVSLVTARMSKPLLDVSAAAQGLAAGDYSRRVPQTRHDEIGALAEAFNAMAAKLEEATRHQAQLASIVESSGDAIISKTLDGTVRTWNAGAERLYGYAADEMIGQSVARLFPAGEWTEMLHILQQIRDGASIRNAETVRVRKDGSRVNIALTVSPIRENGVVVGASTIARDITELKLAEGARLRGVQLQEESRRAQEANRLKSEFLANMSHELRTPLNAIIGFTDLMHKGKAGAVSAEQEEYLGDILTSSRHLLQLINDILDLAKVESGRMEFRPARVELTTLTREVTDVLRGLAASKRLRLNVAIDPDMPEVVIDAARVKQILYNYLSNAIKFTPEGGQIDIRLAPEGAAEFRIEVQDTGNGIAHDQLGRLFHEFQQLDDGSSKKHQGTGLGLALTKRLVEAHGGRVGVRSTVGHGSTFIALLPRAMTTAALEDDGALAPAGDGAPSAILVVEDNPREQQWLAATLREAGHEVEVAASGAEAIAKCIGRRYDAITLDLLLTDMHGWQVLDAVRGSTINAGVPVIAVSVFSEGAEAAGFQLHDYIVKPVTANHLLASVARACRNGATLLPPVAREARHGE